jgi:hypothetical protein
MANGEPITPNYRLNFRQTRDVRVGRPRRGAYPGGEAGFDANGGSAAAIAGCGVRTRLAIGSAETPKIIGPIVGQYGEVCLHVSRPKPGHGATESVRSVFAGDVEAG